MESRKWPLCWWCTASVKWVWEALGSLHSSSNRSMMPLVRSSMRSERVRGTHRACWKAWNYLRKNIFIDSSDQDKVMKSYATTAQANYSVLVLGWDLRRSTPRQFLPLDNGNVNTTFQAVDYEPSIHKAMPNYWQQASWRPLPHTLWSCLNLYGGKRYVVS